MRGRSSAMLVAVGVVVSAVVVLGLLVATGRVSLQPSPTVAATSSMPTVTPTASTASVLGDSSSGSPSPDEPEDAAPTPSVHIVHEGDTLSGIAQKYGVGLDELIDLNQLANPDLLRLGQEILVPAGGARPSVETPAPAATPEPADPTAPLPEQVGTAVPTPTSSGPPLIEIAQVLNSSILGEEVVVIRNRGGAVSLADWTLTGGQGISYTFPAVTLYADAEVRLHSRTGTNSPGNLFRGLVEPAWSGGELITLRDAQDAVVDTYIVP